MKVDRPKPNTFLVRGLQWTTVIERMFNAENAQAREEWIAAIKTVSDNLKREEAMNPTPNDQEMVDVSELPQAMEPGTYDPLIHGSLSANDNVFSEFTEFGARNTSVLPTTSSNIPKDKRSKVVSNLLCFNCYMRVTKFLKNLFFCYCQKKVDTIVTKK